MKLCDKCGKKKPVSEFWKRDPSTRRCIECQTKAMSRYEKKYGKRPMVA